MRRIASALIISAFLIPQAFAAEAYKDWMDYFEGAWSYEMPGGEKGDLELKYVPGKYAMVGTRDADRKSVQLIGWQADRGVLVDTQYNSDGSYSVVEYDKITEKQLSGQFTLYSAGEPNLKGAKVVVTRKGENEVEATISLPGAQQGAGDLVITYRRKQP